jgi:hypothetical protein
MIEVSKFRLRVGTDAEDFLEHNAHYQQHFAYQQNGLLRRTVASGLDGEWIAITWWRSMRDARASAAAAVTSPEAEAFDALLETTSIVTEFFKELPG